MDTVARKQEMYIFGILLIVMGIALFAFSRLFGGTDFLSRLMAGISVGEMSVGVYIIGRSLAK
ncbi:hypothetical protein ACTNB0_09575 [Lachnospiraceae bacterium HCP28S3_F9]|uniref:hypothetical protein n=2 Tax=Lachnospirales TaxID=3085636 RepID=UPI001F30186A|nr:hypothetical protein [Faecalicatena contorta]MCF2684268.1 hypothetical protein [Faecalicatena contorta]